MKSKRRRRNDVVLNCRCVWKLQSWILIDLRNPIKKRISPILFLFFPIAVMYRTLARLSEEVRMDQTQAGRTRNRTRLVTRPSYVRTRRWQSDNGGVEQMCMAES